MKYVTGIHALNTNCSLLTSGDWHRSALKWENIHFRDIKDSIFGDYGIEYGKKIPERDGTYAVANHIRAILDLLETERYDEAQGMRNDFIDNDAYDREIFDMISKMRSLPNWDTINEFIGREYLGTWLDYKEESGL